LSEGRGILGEEAFRRMISLERKRTERSRKPFLFMLLNRGNGLPSDKNGTVLRGILSAISLSTRETDIVGWYENNSVVGVMFTEIVVYDKSLIISTMLARVSEALRSHLSREQVNQIHISFHLFPEEWNNEMRQGSSYPALYPDLLKRNDSKKLFRAMKRMMDIMSSVMSLVFCAPLFLVIAIAIKMSSQGPVFFRQTRVGQYGVPFVFLKFRSMYLHSDVSTHKEYVKQLIAGQAERLPSNGNGEGVYKLTHDNRVTPAGRFLRRTSLDELPQFVNVLRGEMSLVGPRPAIAYEVEAYDIWHRRRLLEAKPGITGLWQVNGRSRVKFDEMVRLDLRYARTCSPWLDIKILLRTPRAVMLGEGAY
jgi:lipopolysaccharide/colanic/teichoic acid biosynthesis glycosyltransferase